jgi:hypothetical protein
MPAEHLVVRNVFEFAIVQEPGTLPSGQYHIPRIPGKLVLPGIVFKTRSHQSPGAGLKGLQGTPFFPDPVNHLHGRHVVYSRVNPALVHQYNSLFSGILVQGPDGWGQVGGRYHVPAQIDTGFSDQVMHSCRQQAHDYIGTFYLFLPLFYLVDIKLKSLSMGMALDNFNGLFRLYITHPDSPLMLL